jgi:RimJ/RimL family protein N-acetyltransferase
VTIPELETERLFLRAWRDEDRNAYARIVADSQVMRYMLPARPLTRAEAAYDLHRLEEHWLEHGFGHWAVEDRATGRLVGRSGIKRHADWSLDPDNTECGWLFERAAWGRGYATEGARAAIAFAREELGRPEVISIAHPDNAASRRVMEKAGLAYAGRHHWPQRGLDVVWYSSAVS